MYEKIHFELKNTSQGKDSIHRGTAHFLCTYHLTSVRTIKRNQSEQIRTIPISFSFTNLWFEWKSDLTIPEIFDSNENPFRHVPNRFHLHAHTEFFLIRIKIRAIGCYVVITYITQICVVRNQQASRNHRASSTYL